MQHVAYITSGLADVIGPRRFYAAVQYQIPQDSPRHLPRPAGTKGMPYLRCERSSAFKPLSPTSMKKQSRCQLILGGVEVKRRVLTANIKPVLHARKMTLPIAAWRSGAPQTIQISAMASAASEITESNGRPCT